MGSSKNDVMLRGGEGFTLYIIVTTCDVGKGGGVKGSVTSHTSHLWKGTIDSQIHVANSPYVPGRETFRNSVVNFTQCYALN